MNAERNLPLSIMITLGLVTSLYITASLALVGMQIYTDISVESGYPEAFNANNVEWAAQLTAVSKSSHLHAYTNLYNAIHTSLFL